MTRLSRIAFPLLASFALGCGSRQSVDRARGIGREVSAGELSDVPVKGHSVRVELFDGDAVDGELLAQDFTSLWLLSSGGTVERVATGCVEAVLVSLYSSAFGAASAGITAAGVLSTPTHGAFLIVSFPVWLAAGIPASSFEISRGRYEVERVQASELWQFARYPQGPPEALLRSLDRPGATPPSCL